jgi:nicotinamidase-related amidase
VTQPFALLDVQDSLLIVIDVQDFFLRKLDDSVANRVVGRIRWLVQVAGSFKIPIIVTAENVENNGPTTAQIRDVLPRDAADLNKVSFGLAAQPEILQKVQATGKKTAILVGLETDVCVQHSAFGLAERGYTVVVVVDATASPETGHQIGLERMRSAGIAMVSCKSLFYEWARDLATTDRIVREYGLGPPEGLKL